MRTAVASANATLETDTIEFAIPGSDTNCTTGGVCTITLTSGEIPVNSASTAGILTITNSTGASNLLISGNNTSRVFYVNKDANLTLNGMTITKGNGTGTTQSGENSSGGGIYNYFAILTLTNTTLSENTASNAGGGITNNGGTLTLTNSTVSGNPVSAADGRAGGIFNVTGGTSTLVNSTVSGNTAAAAGGILSDSNLNLISVTVTNNRSTRSNCSNCAGGILIIHNIFSTANLKNTMVAGNIVTDAFAPPDFSGTVSSTSSYSIIGNNKGTSGITNGVNGNQVGTSTNPIDPRLGVLAFNGGLTQTHALLTGSPAINSGDNTNGLTTDQRGYARIVGNIIDIGAFEYAPVVKSQRRIIFF